MKKLSSFRSRLVITVLFLLGTAFSLPALAGGDSRLFFLAAAVPGIFLFFSWLPARIFSLDLPAVTFALILCAFSVLAPAVSDPDTAVSQGLHCMMGLILIALGAVFFRLFRFSFPSALFSGFFALLLLSLPLWIPVPFSITEVALAFLLISVSSFLSLRSRLPALGISLFGLAFLLLQQDYVSSSVWAITSILVIWACSGSALWSGLSFLSVGALFACVSLLSVGCPEAHSDSLLPRFTAMSWIGPLSVASEESVGDVNGPLFLSLGDQYGVVFLLCLALLLLLLLLRCSSLSQCARNFFHASVALGIMLLWGLRTLSFFLSLAGILPFSVTDPPFLSSSLPDLAGQMLLLGFLSGVSARNREDLKEDMHLAMLAR